MWALNLVYAKANQAANAVSCGAPILVKRLKMRTFEGEKCLLNTIKVFRGSDDNILLRLVQMSDLRHLEDQDEQRGTHCTTYINVGARK